MLATGLWLRLRSPDSDRLTEPIRRGRIVEAVYGIGTVAANKSFALKPAVPSTVRELFVKEGDRVKRGQRLAALDEGVQFHAPFAGTVTSLPIKEGETVFGQSVLLELVDLLDRYVVVSLARGAPAPFKVTAVFATGNRVFDRTAYAAIADVQRVNRTPNQVNKISIRTVDHAQAAALARTWSALGTDKVESWDQKNSNIFQVFKIQDAVRFLSVGAIMIVAAFGIYNILNMTVMQKRRDVAILRSMGYRAQDIVFLFLSQGLILSFAGVALGLSFGYAFSFYLETIPLAETPLGGGVGHLIVSRYPWIYLQAAFLALFSALLASVLPARAAGRLSPIEIIRLGAE